MTQLESLFSKNKNAKSSNETSQTSAPAVDKNDSNQELTAEESGENNGDPKLIATSAPIQRFKIGRFQFERSVLNLYDDKDIEDFRELLQQLPPADRNQIKIIDREAAESLVRPIEPGATQQIDSSVGRQRESLATGDPVVGNEPLEGTQQKFAKSMEDNNVPVGGAPAANVVNQKNEGNVQSPDEVKTQQDVNNT